MPDPVLGLFADGVTRPVRLDAAGQQDVLDGDGRPVAGPERDPEMARGVTSPTPAYRRRPA